MNIVSNNVVIGAMTIHLTLQTFLGLALWHSIPWHGAITVTLCINFAGVVHGRLGSINGFEKSVTESARALSS